MKEKASPFHTSEPEVLSRLLQMGLANLPIDTELDDSTPPETVIKVISGYELLRELGRGGSGVVYLARQKNIQRLVAFKILGGHQFGDGTVRLRFQREAELVATLQHPHIVRIYEFGIWEELPFYSMQYIEGTNLRERIRAGDLTWQQAVRWAASIAVTVHFAHRKGVLHRDLKPENILIDLDEQLHLTDFGLARRIEEAQGITLTGTVMGTPHYIAPEVLSSYGRDVSPAADLYAIGAILYEMLTGTPPFAGKNLAEIAENIRRNEHVPPSRIRPGIPRQLDAICLKALRKKPHQRYATTQELAEALTATLTDPSLPAKATIARERVPERISPNRTALYLLALFSIFLLLGSVFLNQEWTKRLWVTDSQSSHDGRISPAAATTPPTLTLTSSTNHLSDQEAWTNSLGEKFVPAGTPGVLFSIWDVRVKDFKAFVDATGYDATAGLVSFGIGLWKQRGDTWESPGFAQSSNDPVCGVSWNDAEAFCHWLTAKERARGQLTSDQEYRLPTDAEWSTAVGLDEDIKGTPKDKSDRIEKVYPWGTVFPWGTTYPPPLDAGNYNRAGDGSLVSRYSDIPGNDGYPYTSPVGSFKPNRYDLFDMGGDVWNWCEDQYDGVDDLRVLRGGSCFTNAREHLLSSYRAGVEPSTRDVKLGFRAVLVEAPQPRQ